MKKLSFATGLIAGAMFATPAIAQSCCEKDIPMATEETARGAIVSAMKTAIAKRPLASGESAIIMGPPKTDTDGLAFKAATKAIKPLNPDVVRKECPKRKAG